MAYPGYGIYYHDTVDPMSMFDARVIADTWIITTSLPWGLQRDEHTLARGYSQSQYKNVQLINLYSTSVMVRESRIQLHGTPIC